MSQFNLLHKLQEASKDAATVVSGLLKLNAAAGAAAANALLMGVGTTADPATTATADKAMLEFRCQSTASSGDNRLLYMRYALDGGGGGEALRALTSVGSNLGTAHGAHLSLAFKAEAGGSECSGLGCAARATLHIPNVASWAPTGTLAAVQAEIYSDGANSDPAGLTDLSFLRVVNGGNATGGADVDDDANLFSFNGLAAGAGNVFSAAQNMPAGTGVTYGIRCKHDTLGTGYLLFVTSLAT